MMTRSYGNVIYLFGYNTSNDNTYIYMEKK